MNFKCLKNDEWILNASSMNFKKFRGKEKSGGRQSTWLSAAFSPNSVGEELYM